MTVPIVRKRVKRPKTRTGCRTCRARHVKCDETSFPCMRCLRAARVCDGYDVPVNFTPPPVNNKNFLLPKTHGPSAIPPILTSPAITGLNSAESHAFDFFRREAVWQLPGSSLDWEKLVLQASYDEPAITHTAMAIGFLCSTQYLKQISSSLHTNMQDERRSHALHHYNRAIGRMGQYIASLNSGDTITSFEVVLLVCLLFFCFEVLSGEDLLAVAHFRTGLRILYERVKLPSTHTQDGKRTVVMQPIPRNTMDILLNTFIRLDGDNTLSENLTPYLHPIVIEEIPAYFGSLEEARTHLEAMSTIVYEIFYEADAIGREIVMSSEDNSIRTEEEIFCLASVTSRFLPSETHPDLTERMRVAREDLQSWSNAFCLLPHQSNAVAARLMIQIEFFELWLQTCAWKDENETMADRLEDQLTHLLRLAEQYIDLHLDRHTASTPGGSRVTPTTRQAFPLGTRLVPCLAGMSWKCRNPALRRRCISLLRRINMDGVSDSEYLASLSETVALLEEGRAREILGRGPDEELTSSDIPEQVRILELEMCPNEDKPDFWKLDIGRFVYVTAEGAGSELQLHEATFKVERNQQP